MKLLIKNKVKERMTDTQKVVVKNQDAEDPKERKKQKI
jgi:hypothetical protein